MKDVCLNNIVVATILPFNDDFSIDWKSYDRLLAYCLAAEEVASVFVNGHAGEGAALTMEERSAVIRHTRRFIGSEVPLLSGIIPYSTADAVEQARKAEEAGADVAVLFPMPQYAAGANVDPRYALDYVDRVLDAISIPVSIFQQPVSSGLGFSTGVLAEIVQRPRVIAVKEGSADIALYEDNWRLLKAAAPDVAILPSNYHWLFAQVAVGADGVLSGLASLLPHLLSELWAATREQDLRRMRAANDVLYPLAREIYGLPPLIDMHTRIKVALKHLKIIDNAIPRPPLLPVPEDVARQVIATIDRVKLPSLSAA